MVRLRGCTEVGLLAKDWLELKLYFKKDPDSWLLDVKAVSLLNFYTLIHVMSVTGAAA